MLPLKSLLTLVSILRVIIDGTIESIVENVQEYCNTIDNRNTFVCFNAICGIALESMNKLSYQHFNFALKLGYHCAIDEIEVEREPITG